MNRLLWLAGLLGSCVGWPGWAQDWPQWGRTSARNMYAPVRDLPARFDPGQLKSGSDGPDLSTARNVRRVLKLGSQTYGNVTVAGGKIFIGTNNEHPRNPQHQGDRSILLCFDERTGEFLWQLVVPKLASGKANDWEQIGLVSSPTVEGQRLYLVTTRCEIMCLDTEGLANGNDGPFLDEAQYIVGPGQPKAELTPQDADIIWVFDMRDEVGAFPHNAANCSVLVVGDLVYACTSNGQDWTHANVPAPLAPSVVAVDKRTGQLRAEDDAGIGPRIFHGQWSSPSSGQVNGQTLIFFGGGDGWLYAFDAKPVRRGDSSYLKTVWKYDCNPPEYRFRNGTPVKYSEPDGPSEIIATPVFYKNRVYVAIGQDPEQGEGAGHLVCVDATGSGDVTRTHTVWSFKQIHRSLSTVAIDEERNLLFTADLSGFVYCLDADTGQLYWTHDMKAHIWGSALVADGKVYCGDEDGDVVVFASSKQKQILSAATVDGRLQDGPNLHAPIYSTPVAANGALYIATSTHLWVFAEASGR
jgi:outer membrane protein assembly factor BamB